jgi:hypothetical protein
MKRISQRYLSARAPAHRSLAGALVRAVPLAIAFLVASPALCHAWSLPEFFAKPVSEGGGGGRFFTASYFDGYGCSVCHSGGSAPQLQVNGLPANYQPGVTYDIEVTWDKPASLVALHLEMVGRDGRVPGQVVLPDPMTVDARGRCGGRPEGRVPAFQQELGARKVLGVDVCTGLQSLRFRFTPADVPEFAFSASSVRSNGQADVLGDGVTTMRKVLRRVGEPARTGDCALASGTASSRWPLLVLALLALVAAKRSRRQASR